MKLLILVACVTCVTCLHLPSELACDRSYPSSGLSESYSENVAHAVHSMTLQGLQMFNPKAPRDNRIPTVNHNVTSPFKVVGFAPDDPWGSDFSTRTMNMIDQILSGVGGGDDGLGPFWSPLERVVHSFHMWDLWERIHVEFKNIVLESRPDDETCKCLLSVDKNGIRAHVQWVADHYKAGTPITLLNRPIPKLTDGVTWRVWKERLLHYYTPEALRDAALYLYCASF